MAIPAKDENPWKKKLAYLLLINVRFTQLEKCLKLLNIVNIN